MLSVVAMHAIFMVGFNPSEGILPYAAECAFKYGTIGFFLISGFLLGDRIDVASPLSYLSRRLKILLRPWAFWFALYVAYSVASYVDNQKISLSSLSSWAHGIWSNLEIALFGTSFWFVPNLAIGMCILVLFRHKLHSVRLGLLLFAVNAVYVANIYGEWFSPNHNSALFAYVCFLWLGTYTARNFARFSRSLDRVPMAALALLTLLSFLVSVAEVKLLLTRHSVEPMNTLRLSNQVFSILVVLVLVKVKTVTWPSFAEVRQQTYCIYLVHMFYLRFAFAVCNRVFGRGLMGGSHPSISFLLRALLFVFAYGGSILASKVILASHRWSWIIGVQPGSRDKLEVPSKSGAKYDFTGQNMPVR